MFGRKNLVRESAPHSCPESAALFPATKPKLFSPLPKATAKFPVDFAGQTDIELTERNWTWTALMDRDNSLRRCHRSRTGLRWLTDRFLLFAWLGIVRASNNCHTTSLRLRITFLASRILLFQQCPILLSNLKVLIAAPFYSESQVSATGSSQASTSKSSNALTWI